MCVCVCLSVCVCVCVCVWFSVCVVQRTPGDLDIWGKTKVHCWGFCILASCRVLRGGPSVLGGCSNRCKCKCRFRCAYGCSRRGFLCLALLRSPLLAWNLVCI